VRIIAGEPPGSDPGAIDAALELTAVAMLLVAAVAFFVAVLRGLRTPAVKPAPAPTGAVERSDDRRDAAPSPIGSVTVGPVTDGIRILTPALVAGDPGEGHDRAGGPPRRLSRANPHRRGRPDRGRPPGRARD
jgi:hypothetical protein